MGKERALEEIRGEFIDKTFPQMFERDKTTCELTPTEVTGIITAYESHLAINGLLSPGALPLPDALLKGERLAQMGSSGYLIVGSEQDFSETSVVQPMLMLGEDVSDQDAELQPTAEEETIFQAELAAIEQAERGAWPGR